MLWLERSMSDLDHYISLWLEIMIRASWVEDLIILYCISDSAQLLLVDKISAWEYPARQLSGYEIIGTVQVTMSSNKE